MGCMRDLFKATLQVAKQVLAYYTTPGHDPEDYNLLRKFVKERLPDLDSADFLEIMQFLKELAPTLVEPRAPVPTKEKGTPPPARRPKTEEEWDVAEVDLSSEANGMYNHVRNLLFCASGDDNKKDLLQMCIKSMETIVRLKEKIYNIEQVQEMERTLLACLDAADPSIRDAFLARLEEVQNGV